MVDLLATNLAGVAGISTVAPRAVLKSWAATMGRSDDLARALAVGRDLDAGSVVVGSAVSTGGRVRLVADLYSIDGERLGPGPGGRSGGQRARRGGPAQPGAPARRLAIQGADPEPAPRLAHHRLDRGASVVSPGRAVLSPAGLGFGLGAYTRAVESDSTFALAHLRRAQVFGWTGGYGSKESHEALVAGARFANRLQPRDRRLLVGYQLFDQGKPAAIDSLRAFVAEYPEDVEGWYLLGESMFHIKSFPPGGAGVRSRRCSTACSGGTRPCFPP